MTSTWSGAAPPATPLSDFIQGLLVDSAPRQARRLERKVLAVVAFDQRWRRRRDGLIVQIVQLHRAERVAEVRSVAPAAPGDPWEHGRYLVSFGELGSDYDLLVSMSDAR